MKICKQNKKMCLKRMFYYIRCCVILDNLLIEEETEEYEDDDLSVIDADNVLNRAMPDFIDRDFRRQELKNYIMDKYYV